MRVAIAIDPRDPRRDRVRDDAEFWLGNRARAGRRVREDEDDDRRAVLVFDFSDPLDAIDLSMRAVPSKHRGRVL